MGRGETGGRASGDQPLLLNLATSSPYILLPYLKNAESFQNGMPSRKISKIGSSFI